MVTAAGIERKMRETSYAVQEMGGEQLAQRSEPNVMNALQGKVAGLGITGLEIISSRVSADNHQTPLNKKGFPNGKPFLLHSSLC
jgi:hypothetical protein